jgi:hypothetical protein
MVPALFDDAEKDGLASGVRDAAVAAGLDDSREGLWNFFVDRCRANLHVVLAMSPVGEALRTRCRRAGGAGRHAQPGALPGLASQLLALLAGGGWWALRRFQGARRVGCFGGLLHSADCMHIPPRNFPGLVNNTVIDWFEPWPEQVGGAAHCAQGNHSFGGGDAPIWAGRPNAPLLLRAPRPALPHAKPHPRLRPATRAPVPATRAPSPATRAPAPQALESVASAFLAGDDLPDALRAGVVAHMVGVHQSVRAFSSRFEAQLRRHNYVTVGAAGGLRGWEIAGLPPPGLLRRLKRPRRCFNRRAMRGMHYWLCVHHNDDKRPETNNSNPPPPQPKNYLDYISTYRRLLSTQRRGNEDMAARLTGGLAKLEQAATEVDALQRELSQARVVVQAATEECNHLLEVRAWRFDSLQDRSENERVQPHDEHRPF